MRNTDFGWDYPPGVSSVPGDEYDPCDGCDFWGEESDRCMVCPGDKHGSPDYNYCPKMAAKNCPVCKKAINRLLTSIPKDHWGADFSAGSMPCCSKECADKITLESEKINTQMRDEAKKTELHARRERQCGYFNEEKPDCIWCAENYTLAQLHLKYKEACFEERK